MSKYSQIFRISVWEASILIYWMSYCRNLVVFAYSKYFIVKKFKTSIERNSRQTDLPPEIWQHLLCRLWESNTKTEFVFHISAMLVPAHLKIAPLPISSEGRHLWWKNKSPELKKSLCNISFCALKYNLNQRTSN